MDAQFFLNEFERIMADGPDEGGLSDEQLYDIAVLAAVMSTQNVEEDDEPESEPELDDDDGTDSDHPITVDDERFAATVQAGLVVARQSFARYERSIQGRVLAREKRAASDDGGRVADRTKRQTTPDLTKDRAVKRPGWLLTRQTKREARREARRIDRNLRAFLEGHPKATMALTPTQRLVKLTLDHIWRTFYDSTKPGIYRKFMNMLESEPAQAGVYQFLPHNMKRWWLWKKGAVEHPEDHLDEAFTKTKSGHKKDTSTRATKKRTTASVSR